MRSRITCRGGVGKALYNHVDVHVLHDGVYVEAYTKSPVVLCDRTGVTAEQHMLLFVLLLIQVIVVV